MISSEEFRSIVDLKILILLSYLHYHIYTFQVFMYINTFVIYSSQLCRYRSDVFYVHLFLMPLCTSTTTFKNRLVQN